MSIRIGKVRLKPICGNCRHFRRRDPGAPWPVAGVPASAEGQCGGPTLTPRPGAWRPWQRATDSCDRFDSRETGK